MKRELVENEADDLICCDRSGVEGDSNDTDFSDNGGRINEISEP